MHLLLSWMPSDSTSFFTLRGNQRITDCWAPRHQTHTSFSWTCLRLIVHSEVFELTCRLLLITWFLDPSSYKEISTNPVSFPCFTKSLNYKYISRWLPPLSPSPQLTSFALPKSVVEPPRPRQSAHTMLDFPVPVFNILHIQPTHYLHSNSPLGPTMTFSCGLGLITTRSKVLHQKKEIKSVK